MQVSAAFDVNLGFTFCESGLPLRAWRRVARIARPDQDAREQRRMAVLAARCGYSALYTPDWRGADALALCRLRCEATRDAMPGGLRVGTLVSPIPKYPDPEAMARRAVDLVHASRGRFVLGIGSGDLDRVSVRESLGWSELSVVDVVRRYLVRLHGAIEAAAPDPGDRPAIVLAAIGPRMLEIGGELADGVVLAFATPTEIATAREHVAVGAARVGRDPSRVGILQSVPVCVSSNVALARRRLRVALLPYLTGPTVPAPGDRRWSYRRQLERLGFGAVLDELDAEQRAGATRERLLERIPDELLARLGHAGAPAGASTAVAKLSQGLDEVVVRITAVTEWPGSVAEALRAMAPGPGWVVDPRPPVASTRPGASSIHVATSA